MRNIGGSAYRQRQWCVLAAPGRKAQGKLLRSNPCPGSRSSMGDTGRKGAKLDLLVRDLEISCERLHTPDPNALQDVDEALSPVPGL
jgi:hypothetical protein